MNDNSEFAPTDIACKGINDEVKELIDEGMSETDAIRQAASTMDGAGDNPQGTVESVQTCFTLDRKPVKGLTGSDSPSERKDEFASTQRARQKSAEKGKDEAAEWLRQNDPNYLKSLDEKLVKKYQDQKG
jgi:hypothetical protein